LDCYSRRLCIIASPGYELIFEFFLGYYDA
jgi:hypothetical protein